MTSTCMITMHQALNYILKVGEALPFQIVDEFRGYVINNFAPKFIDNAGWDCNVTWEMKILTTSTLLRALLGHVTIYYN